ncbi:MAG: aminodeoxychorismate/anthranilate synthase component II [Planctomycetota bacterium]|nr:MAG: aminodeoxychorismate/anthranilate synthase component II [Planctomycetota bacterium]
MILLLDNYDSFTYNLYQALAAQGAEVAVHRNDALSVEQALALQPSAVVLSPGPGRPEDAGIMPELVARLPERVPLLGVCLGHQCLVQQHGGRLERDPVPVHGKASLVHHDNQGLFRGLPNPFPAGRYHSLRAVRDALPADLKLTAWTEEGVVMAVAHRSAPRFGVQFHPESILTPQGERLLARFLALAGEAVSAR